MATCIIQFLDWIKNVRHEHAFLIVIVCFKRVKADVDIIFLIEFAIEVLICKRMMQTRLCHRDLVVRLNANFLVRTFLHSFRPHHDVPVQIRTLNRLMSHVKIIRFVSINLTNLRVTYCLSSVDLETGRQMNYYLHPSNNNWNVFVFIANGKQC